MFEGAIVVLVHEAIDGKLLDELPVETRIAELNIEGAGAARVHHLILGVFHESDEMFLEVVVETNLLFGCECGQCSNHVRDEHLLVLVLLEAVRERKLVT
jgi:hypothetical protein